MPREDVPYPGRAICSIKERIEEIADEVDEKIETINGVGGNGAGNVTIYSETPAILVNSDAAHNQIGLDFDVSQVVTSVNSQTGDVTLDAGDVLGSDDLGNAGTPIYLSGGSAAACTVDASPVSGSANLVTSGGVYSTSGTPPGTYSGSDVYGIGLISGSTAYIFISTNIRSDVTSVQYVGRLFARTYSGDIGLWDLTLTFTKGLLGQWSTQAALSGLNNTYSSVIFQIHNSGTWTLS